MLCSLNPCMHMSTVLSSKAVAQTHGGRESLTQGHFSVTRRWTLNTPLTVLSSHIKIPSGFISACTTTIRFHNYYFIVLFWRFFSPRLKHYYNLVQALTRASLGTAYRRLLMFFYCNRAECCCCFYFMAQVCVCVCVTQSPQCRSPRCLICKAVAQLLTLQSADLPTSASLIFLSALAAVYLSNRCLIPRPLHPCQSLSLPPPSSRPLNERAYLRLIGLKGKQK